MIIDYTFKTGETSAVKKILEFLESQDQVAKNINDKVANKKAYRMES